MGGLGLVDASTDVEARELAKAFYRNGRGFLRAASDPVADNARDICYSLAIASELVLKSFLLTRDWNDDRCRCEIRHDLERGLACVAAAGLDGLPDDFSYVVGVLNAYYPKHAFMDFAVPPGDPAFVARARSTVVDVYKLVGRHVRSTGGA
ncbi:MULTISPECIES: hypothetical protein [unclassified Rhizobium]|uniref:hypothetical protein n=1 Tax=unclassified Rhizobium TaxID=2613769 RepID=UPI000647F8EF|nr:MULTISPECIES: hypothetical protein [unclassified Rhizobium]OJY74071.1 MAG: hypothetical protein BGP09_27110 [Rhizobium sp. 60-20]RKD61505.1 hypothetical protein BJ928_107106 [Rhizobium sp. WW_1]